MKSYMRKIMDTWNDGRPRKGAWIEIMIRQSTPGRDRCRPRKGAWIEIHLGHSPLTLLRRPRKGAWIEISKFPTWWYIPTGRPRKGAWIEMALTSPLGKPLWSPPQGGVD